MRRLAPMLLLLILTAEYPIRLDSPLGNRVLVDPAGNPIPVIRS